MEYALPAGMFAGVLFFFWGISTMLSGGGAGSVEERMARYAGGKTEVKTADGRTRGRQRNLVDPFATLSSDVQDKRFQIRVQRDLARANLKLRVAEYYSIRVGLAVGLGLLLGVLRDPLSGVVGAILGYFVPRFWVGQRIGGRLSAFNKQLASVDRARLARNARSDGRGDGPRRA